ncbi:hypothetical protein IFM89_024816 [Coptis chinensis]|uniref:Uncharacterized protein n=1 Tax=Coptis chinensis TaxID=261450 RepID=A0A835M0Z7_9MAGN|nr:hypothetical protein IFM89_024816 [Coptis chinensis]
MVIAKPYTDIDVFIRLPKAIAKPYTDIDVFIRLPKECFHEKDYLNHRYHGKRFKELVELPRFSIRLIPVATLLFDIGKLKLTRNNLHTLKQELALTQYELIWYCSSMVATSAVYVACCTLNKSPFWDETLKHHTGFSESQLLKFSESL